LANTQSAIKRVRQERKRRIRNRMIKARMRTHVRKAQELLAEGDVEESGIEAVREAISQIDKAAQKGIIHPNQAARRKARLMKRLNDAL
jgi:small subunit ribosomal protein S20